MTHRILLCWLLVGCTPPATPSPTSDPAGGACAGLGACALVEVPGNPLAAAVELQADRALTVSVEVDGAPWTEPVGVAAGDAATLDVLGLAPDVPVTVQLVGTHAAGARVAGPAWDWTPEPWPAQGPTAEITGDPPDPDATVCTNASVGEGAGLDQLYWCTDLQGTPRWATRHPDGLALLLAEPLADGRLALTARPDRVVLVDAAGRWQHEWRAADLVGATVAHDSFDPHEVVQLRQGPWAGALAALTLADEEIDGERVRGHGIVVFDPDDGSVLWDWSAHGAPGDGVSVDPVRLPYARRGLADVPGGDWLHANALVHLLDADGEGFLLSSRSQDWLLRIDVATGEIVWRLGFQGDFELVDDLDAPTPTPLTDEAWFFHQHAPEVEVADDGRWTVLLVDNGNVRADDPALQRQPAPYSRLLELTVDAASRRVSRTVLWGTSDDLDPGHWYAWAQGDLDRLPDGSLLWLEGMSPHASGLPAAGGEPTWTVSFPDLPSAYRALYGDARGP